MEYIKSLVDISIVGIFIAAVISALGFFFRNRLENKKSARKTLYYLLEIRYAILMHTQDADEATQKYIEHYKKQSIKKGWPKINDSDELELIKIMIKDHFENMISTAKVEITDKLLDLYESSLLELATVKPVLAYSLRGREVITQFIGHTQAYKAQFEINVLQEISEERIRTELQTDFDSLSEHAVKNMIKIIRNDVLGVARYCGPIVFIRTVCVLIFRANWKNRYDFSIVDKHLQKIFFKLKKATGKQHQ